MPINTPSITGFDCILRVRGQCGAEVLDDFFAGGVDVGVGLAECDGFVGDGSCGFCAALLEFTGGGGFVGWSVFAVHFVVGELDDHLDVCVWAALELFDQSFAVGLVGFDAEFVGGH